MRKIKNSHMDFWPQFLAAWIIISSLGCSPQNNNSISQKPAVAPKSEEQSPSQSYSLDQLLSDIKGTNTMEEALPRIPGFLRSSFTLQYEGGIDKGHGLQDADLENPRVIMFANNGEFALTFNGSVSQNKGSNWEILQYTKNQTGEPVFELYDLKFPLSKNSQGEIVRPERNPQECVACHRADPKPIWGRYGDWPGIFDELSPPKSGPIHDALTNFVQNRNAHPRYKYLNPIEGSSLSPLPDGTHSPTYYGFLPSTRLNNAFIHLNSARIAARFRQSPYYKNLLPLLVLTLNRDKQDKVTSEGDFLVHPSCGDVNTSSTDWGWTATDVTLAQNILSSILIKNYGGALPYPQDPVLGPRNVIATFGIKFGDMFPVTKAASEEPDPNDPDSNDFLRGGFFHESWLANESPYNDLINLNPDFIYKLFLNVQGIETFWREAALWTKKSSVDVELVHIWDSYGQGASLTTDSDCKAIYDLLRTRLTAIE